MTKIKVLKVKCPFAIKCNPEAYKGHCFRNVRECEKFWEFEKKRRDLLGKKRAIKQKRKEA